jgi:hypothetical protein
VQRQRWPHSDEAVLSQKGEERRYCIGRPDDCMDFQSGIRTQLEVLQASERGDVDSPAKGVRALRFPIVSWRAQWKTTLGLWP